MSTKIYCKAVEEQKMSGKKLEHLAFPYKPKTGQHTENAKIKHLLSICLSGNISPAVLKISTRNPLPMQE